MAHRLIVVSNRLPISVHEENGALSLSRSNGGLATALASLFQQDSSLWIGWTGLRRHLSTKEIDKLAVPPHLIPINLTNQEVIQYYDLFSNGILWPLAHGLPATSPLTNIRWQNVMHVTRQFADKIEQTANPEDVIWIHDYHLFYLPAELRRRGIKNRIGFFLHTPFPPSRSFHNLPRNHELMQSLLSVDVLGFQTERDVNRFKTLATTLNVPVPPQLTIKSFPIGVDFESFDSLNESDEVRRMADNFKQQIGDKTIIFSLSRLDYTKGILTQLRAFETLLDTLAIPDQVVYRLNIAPSRESMLEYQELREEIESLVSTINSRFGTKQWQPALYTYENIGLQEIAAWYQIADIHLNIPLADGMNLIAKEYIAARRSPGVLIISNTMGAAIQLKEALIVTPEADTEIVHALRQALEMSEKEKVKRWNTLRHNVKTEQVSDWAKAFLDALTK